MKEYRIALGSDHAGYDLKNELLEHIKSQGYEIMDFGCFSTDTVDYPLIGKNVAQAIIDNTYDLGILVCGTGVGMSIVANKIAGIRAVVCSEPFSAKASREHNATNVLTLGARVVGTDLAKLIVDSWLAAKPQGGRHARRVDMITDLEGKYDIGKIKIEL